MGMGASQARLLSITSEIHNIEYKAQNTESQKLQLAMQKDEVYETYMAALDKKKIQVAYKNSTTGGVRYVDANFNTVCTYQEGRSRQYALKDSKTGKLIVDRETYNAYNNWCVDKYSFAWAMLGLETFGTSRANGGNADRADDGLYIGRVHNDIENEMLLMTEIEEAVFNSFYKQDGFDMSYPKLSSAYKNWEEINNNEESTNAQKREALNAFRKELYSANSTPIKNRIFQVMSYAADGGLDKYQSVEDALQYIPNDTKELDSYDEFNYYVNLFENIHSSGGCIPLDSICEDGENGNDWFNNMVDSGQAIIEMYVTKGTKQEWIETSPATSTNENFLQKVEDDAELKKAEAIYEHELSIINNKDKKFDTELDKLDTRRNALKNEMDSLKSIIKDNTDKNFGIFS